MLSGYTQLRPDQKQLSVKEQNRRLSDSQVIDLTIKNYIYLSHVYYKICYILPAIVNFFTTLQLTVNTFQLTIW